MNAVELRTMNNVKTRMINVRRIYFKELSVEKCLQTLFVSSSHLFFAYICFIFLQSIISFLQTMFINWLFVIAISLVQIKIPNFGERIQKLTNILTMILKGVLSLVEVIIETIILSFKNTTIIKSD